MRYKKEIKLLNSAMTLSERDNGETFYHFTDNAPKKLVNAFLEEFSVVDRDYHIFYTACNIMSEACEDVKKGEDIMEYINENDMLNGCSSVMIFDRLQLLDIYNQSEISQHVIECECDIDVACALWFDDRLSTACSIINDWLRDTK